MGSLSGGGCVPAAPEHLGSTMALCTAPWCYSHPGQGWWSVWGSLAVVRPGGVCLVLMQWAMWSHDGCPAVSCLVFSRSKACWEKHLGPAHPNKAGHFCTRAASTNLLTGPSTLDTCHRMLLSTLPLHPHLLFSFLPHNFGWGLR